jgi:hypothetical protein
MVCKFNNSLEMRNLNDLSILENIENYPFHKRFKIFKGHSIFDFISPKFPKITDIKIKKLEEDLNEYSSFNFSRSLVGYISLEKNAKESPSFFVSEEYDDFSRSFVGSSFYRMKPYFMNVGEIEKKKIDREFPGKIFPFMYFLQSDNELGKIIIRNFSQKNREDGNYLRGVYVSMGICPRKSGNFTLRALESRIDNAYNTKKAYEKVDLNN